MCSRLHDPLCHRHSRHRPGRVQDGRRALPLDPPSHPLTRPPASSRRADRLHLSLLPHLVPVCSTTLSRSSSHSTRPLTTRATALTGQEVNPRAPAGDDSPFGSTLGAVEEAGEEAFVCGKAIRSSTPLPRRAGSSRTRSLRLDRWLDFPGSGRFLGCCCSPMCRAAFCSTVCAGGRRRPLLRRAQGPARSLRVASLGWTAPSRSEGSLPDTASQGKGTDALNQRGEALPTLMRARGLVRGRQCNGGETGQRGIMEGRRQWGKDGDSKRGEQTVG